VASLLRYRTLHKLGYKLSDKELFIPRYKEKLDLLIFLEDMKEQHKKMEWRNWIIKTINSLFRRK
jgi:hypothetical protein